MPQQNECRYHTTSSSMPSFCQERCAIKEVTINQANNGGYKTADSASKRNISNGPGPFWPRVNFNRFTTETLKIAEREECQRLDELRKSIQEIIAQKEIDRQLID